MISAHQNRELGATIGMGIADLRHTPPNRITTRLDPSLKSIRR
jgi:hypothetical protein